MGLAVLLMGYGAFLGLGGFYAYRRDKGKAGSLVVGGFAGTVLILCGALAWTLLPRFGAWAGLIMTFLMTFLFAMRYRKTKKVRPAGFMTVLSLLVLVGVGYLMFA
jgi:hypothetical protein